MSITTLDTDHSKPLVTYISPRTVQLVERYRSFAKKTVENVLELAKTIVEVEQTLDESEQIIFFEQIHVKRKGSHHKKLRVIGNNHARFLPHIRNLPGNWTTLYLLAKLPSEEFDSIARQKIFSPDVTADTIKSASTSKKTPKKSSKKAQDKFNVLIDTSDASDECLTILDSMLAMIAQELDLRIETNPDLYSKLEDAKTKVQNGTPIKMLEPA